ncbi:8638_t:CDS:2 [Diversispora eburnea]|uniref:8638_t:CDS:1 n=1 Tax=Diversispora eburnea TaxID=1213867 RepID=A0A9N8VA89_9GLOM|nr:8638_t:CDS:2 [Diversispora eburnea]
MTFNGGNQQNRSNNNNNQFSHKKEKVIPATLKKQVDCEAGNYSVGVSATCKVILKDGTFHMDIGYGSADKMKNKSMALEKAKKEAVADALKRTLRKFGNFLGNCLYDREYSKQIRKVKVSPHISVNVSIHVTGIESVIKRNSSSSS